MKRSISVLFALISFLVILACSTSAHSAITWTGDLDPADPTAWDSGTFGYVGETGDGELTVDGGSALLSRSGSVGDQAGATGAVTINGAGSMWNTNSLNIGYGGAGSLAILDHGEVNVEAETYVGWAHDSSGAIHFDNGTLNTGSLLCGSGDLSGTGAINTHGLVSDLDLAFNATHGLQQTLAFDGPGQNITVSLDASGRFDSFGAGYRGVGSMAISDGVVLQSGLGYIGFHSGSTGSVTIDGIGSTWTNAANLFVGRDGDGSLTITNGGSLSGISFPSVIGESAGSTGVVTVDGNGSTWSVSGLLHVGFNGSGSLAITNGGVVTGGARSWSYVGDHSGSTGAVTVDGEGSAWNNSNSILIGSGGSGSMAVANGGNVSNTDGLIGSNSGSTGTVTVDGCGSTWTNSADVVVGGHGSGALEITHGGLVSVANLLTIAEQEDSEGYINMATGGMLALYGDADGSLAEFLDLVEGTGDIRYWDDSISDWADITGATPGADYTLNYVADAQESLYGYTVLTVGAVPEPGEILMLLVGAVSLLMRRSRSAASSRTR